MADQEKLENQGFKINDRRRFSPEGQPLDKAVGEVAETAKESMEGAAAASTNPPFAEPPADFASLLLSLAAGAQSALGIAPHPLTGKLEKNLAQAKYSIDLLEMLQEKTQGNLLKEEDKLLEALLYDLRMRYVEAKK
jgi:uncharacterized protein DUF1844